MNKFKSLTLFLALLGVAPIASNSIPALNTEISEAPDDCGEFSKTLKSLDSGESSILESSYGFETCEQEALTEQDLKIILYDLYKISGLKTKPGIWQFPEEFDKENRYNVAIDDKKNIFVGTGILKTLSHEELKAVIAHELGHLKHNHIEHDKVTNLFSKLTLAFAASPLFAKLVLKNKIDLKIWLLFLFPRVVYEAMLNSLPVVCTNVGGIPNFLTDGVHALIHSPGDLKGMQVCIEKIINNKEVRKKIISNSYSLIDQIIEKPAYVQHFYMLKKQGKK